MLAAAAWLHFVLPVDSTRGAMRALTTPAPHLHWQPGETRDRGMEAWIPGATHAPFPTPKIALYHALDLTTTSERVLSVIFLSDVSNEEAF